MRDYFVIRGKRKLAGEVEIRGSKNAASKMMVASLLTAKPCTIENVPLSLETEITKELCVLVGSEVRAGEDHSLTVHTREVRSPIVPELSRRNRIPILALGPLLHRTGFAEVPVPGGDPLGHRPINFHIEALSKMGVTIERHQHSYVASAKEIRGADIALPFPSVGATENVVLTATLAKGVTRLENAAMEPEILNLIEMLGRMGARISVAPEARRVEIEGVQSLGGARVRSIPDRNEAVSFAVAALATGGDVFVKGAEAAHLEAFLEKVREIGGSYEIKPGGIRFWGTRRYRATELETAPHPGFMTDWQQPFAVLLTQAEGTSILHETVYEDRFGYTKDLTQMGASVALADECPPKIPKTPCRFFGCSCIHTARITGPAALHAAEIAMRDIRAGIALVIAALAAEGESRISGVEHIDRGYERIDERLRLLGADIKRV